MAFSNAGITPVQPDSEANVPIRQGSPAKLSVAGFTTYTSAGPDVRPGSDLHQHCSYVQRASPNLEQAQFQQVFTAAGSKHAATLDFLSLCGNVPRRQAETSASQAAVPLYRICSSNTEDPASGQESIYPLVKGSAELQSNVLFRMEGGERGMNGIRERLENHAYCSSSQLKFEPPDLGCVPKTTSHPQLEIGQQHVSALNKQWQHAISDTFDMAKRLPRLPSEDDDEDDDEFADQGRDQKRDGGYQKGETSQKLDGKINDNKGSTLRSKHSATEQRRRSKINDRFQMLRQLVPNHDQKRDKASFLLEVIEYIQFLQEKVRKYEAADHGQPHERQKGISWDAGQRSTPIHCSTVTDNSCIDSPLYGKERIPVVMPIEMKQAADVNGLMRSRLTPVVIPGEHDVCNTELVASKSHGSMHMDRPIQSSQWVNMTKSIPIMLSTQPSVHCAFGRSATHVLHAVPHPTLETHTMEQALPKIANMKVSSCNTEAANLPHLHGSSSQQPIQSMNNSNEQMHVEVNTRNPEIGQYDSNSLAIEELGTGNAVPSLLHSGATPSRQFLNAVTAGTGYEMQDVLKVETQESTQVQGSEQERGQVRGDEQEPFTIHGGVISVSSAYSQGLLDTLTKALQSSGLDLSQARISVEINLGKQCGTVGATNAKAVTLHSDVSQQSQGLGTQTGRSPELDHPPHKKPKIEVEN
eukprot:c28908_g1_i1 orf=983-3073(+)